MLLSEAERWFESHYNEWVVKTCQSHHIECRQGQVLAEPIGSSGFGAVYRAKQATINCEVAIKIILPQFANNSDFIWRFES